MVDSDYNTQWWTVISNTCEYDVNFIVGMTTEEWDTIKTYFTVFNADDSIAYHTHMTGCEVDETDDTITNCTFKLGNVNNEKYSETRQDIAGWLLPGGYGVRHWDIEWL